MMMNNKFLDPLMMTNKIPDPMILAHKIPDPKIKMIAAVSFEKSYFIKKIIFHN